MDIYRIDKIDNGIIRISNFFDPGSSCGEFDDTKEGFYEEGDVVYYDENSKEYLFVNNADAQLGWLIIKQLTKNGQLKYADLGIEEQEQYDRAVYMIDVCYKNPKLFDRATSYEFAAERAVRLSLLEGE